MIDYVKPGDGGAPDLQKLVRQYGGYDKILNDEWVKYDAALEAAQLRLRRLHKREMATVLTHGGSLPSPSHGRRSIRSLGSVASPCIAKIFT